MLWIVVAIVWLVGLAFALALCRAAKRGDEAAARGRVADADFAELGVSPLRNLAATIALEDSAQQDAAAKIIFTTHTVKTGPRWWQLRARLARRRLQRAFARERAKIEQFAPGLAGRLDAEVERAFLFGSDTAPSSADRASRGVGSTP